MSQFEHPGWGSLDADAAKASAGGTLCVLGAGNSNDLDLAALATHFTKGVLLLDVDKVALKHGVKMQAARMGGGSGRGCFSSGGSGAGGGGGGGGDVSDGSCAVSGSSGSRSLHGGDKDEGADGTIANDGGDTAAAAAAVPKDADDDGGGKAEGADDGVVTFAVAEFTGILADFPSKPPRESRVLKEVASSVNMHAGPPSASCVNATRETDGSLLVHANVPHH